MTRFTRRSLYLRGSAAGRSASFWRGSQSRLSVPEDSIRTESNIELLTEYGSYLLTES